MLYMVIEHRSEDQAIAVSRRFRDRGRLAPDGLLYVASWVSLDLTPCYQVMECDDPALLDRWIAHWDDLIDFEIISVVTSAEAMERVSFRL